MKNRIGLFIAILLLSLPIAVSAQSRHNHDGGKAPKAPIGSLPETSKGPDEAGTITLDELLRAAMEHNPAIKSARKSADASKSLIQPARTLPDPTITLEHMGDIVPFSLQPGDPSSARTVGVEQEIPFPGKLDLKGKIASAEAEAQEHNYELMHLQVASEIKKVYYELYLIRKSTDSVRKTKDLLRSLTEIAETNYRVGRGIQQDVLRAQLEVSKLIDRIIVLDQRRAISEAQLNALLHRPHDTPVGKPADFEKAELRYSVEDLNRLAQSNSPTLKVQEREVDRRQYSVQLSEKGYYPDFSVGFTYYDRDLNPEMYRVMVSAKVPLYFWRKQKPEIVAAKSNLAGAEHMRESTRATIESQIRQAYVTATSSDQLVKLYSTAVIPQAGFSVESALAGYQVGRTDFPALIDSLTAFLDYELKYHEALAEYQKALAQMEPLAGVELTRQ